MGIIFKSKDHIKINKKTRKQKPEKEKVSALSDSPSHSSVFTQLGQEQDQQTGRSTEKNSGGWTEMETDMDGSAFENSVTMRGLFNPRGTEELFNKWCLITEPLGWREDKM